MPELRFNPLLKTWTMVASDRQNRPQMPKDYCPFCLGSAKVPPQYDVWKYDNDFPTLSQNATAPADIKSSFYRNETAYGKCEVILYSPEHNTTMHQLELPHLRKLVDLWCGRFAELADDSRIKYIFIFENKGEEVGVTMPHPHGQIYAYPYVPQKLEIELNNAKEHYQKNGKCLFCEMNQEELRENKRLIYENKSFVAYLPYFTDYPYGVFIVSKNHKNQLLDFNDAEKNDLADILKVITGSFDSLFLRQFPYMMSMHQTPVNSDEYEGCNDYYHFHIEFYPPLREKNKIKYYASSEMGAWAAANVAAVEDTAPLLRRAKLRYLSGWDTQKMKSEFVDEFNLIFGGDDRNVAVFAAPSRVNLIGEHIDYNGGLVMPAAINRYTYAAIRLRKDKKIILRDLDFTGVSEFELNSRLERSGEVSWANYPKGVLKILLDYGYEIQSGFEALFFSEIPVGTGLSSSASFESVFATALTEMFDLKISKKDIALICQRSEREFVGVNCGIMDQFAVTLGEKNKALLLDCESLNYEAVPMELGEYCLVIINSNKPRKLSDSKYNERRAECEEGMKIIQKDHNISNLCELNPAQLYQLGNDKFPPNIIKRVRHAVTENDRVKRASQAMKEGDLLEFGNLMKESHISLRDDYEVTGLELDTLFDLAKESDGCIGTRMTGAGFGGCTVSIVRKDKLDSFKKGMEEKYRMRTGLTADFIICTLEDGSGKI